MQRSFLADLDRQKLNLSRIVGLPAGQDFSIADLQAAEAGIRSANAALAAARAERYPTGALNADYGAAGLRPTSEAHGVFTVSGTLTVPLYKGGRGSAEIENAQAAVHQRESQRADLRRRIDQEIRLAFIDLNAAADQVDVARSNVDLAQETLVQARDHFAAGIADTVEVVLPASQLIVESPSLSGPRNASRPRKNDCKRLTADGREIRKWQAGQKAYSTDRFSAGFIIATKCP